MSTMAFPLQWPQGHKRTPKHKRQHARFKVTFAQARDHLLGQLRQLGAKYVVISTDIPTRQDGLPRARFRTPDDSGVAVYFDYDGEQMVFACDKWKSIIDNVRAIGKTIEAIRGIARWGSTNMMKQAMSAFKELPAQTEKRHWREVLGIPYGVNPNLEMVKRHYRSLSRQNHPDRGGSEYVMQEINAAWEAAQKELRA